MLCTIWCCWLSAVVRCLWIRGKGSVWVGCIVFYSQVFMVLEAEGLSYDRLEESFIKYQDIDQLHDIYTCSS